MMSRQQQPTKGRKVTVWTPWGEQALDQDESRRSKFRKRLEKRRQNQSRKTETAGKDKPRN
jgi:hypothetical protein